jgi:hypothetical protein
MRYELHSLHGKRWQVETVYDDKTLALADARNLMSGSRAPEAVRVIENDPAGESRSIFHKKKNQPESLQEVRRKKEQEAELKTQIAERKARRKRHAQWEASQGRRNRLRLIAICALAAAIGIGAAAFFLPLR